MVTILDLAAALRRDRRFGTLALVGAATAVWDMADERLLLICPSRFLFDALTQRIPWLEAYLSGVADRPVSVSVLFSGRPDAR